MNMSSSFVALIWWVVPAAGLIGALSYVVWVTKFKDNFESETTRSIGKFSAFQSTFRDPNDQTPVNRNDPTPNELPRSKPNLDQDLNQKPNQDRMHP
jgi:hypothetical protein